MLISRTAQSGSGNRHGGRGLSFAELRVQLGEPSTLSDGHRQRLLELLRRLERVQALGDEYARVGLSPFATAAVCEANATEV